MRSAAIYLHRRSHEVMPDPGPYRERELFWLPVSCRLSDADRQRAAASPVVQHWARAALAAEMDAETATDSVDAGVSHAAAAVAALTVFELAAEFCLSRAT